MQAAPVGTAAKQLAFHHTVPASSASRSVSDICGSTLRYMLKIGASQGTQSQQDHGQKRQDEQRKKDRVHILVSYRNVRPIAGA